MYQEKEKKSSLVGSVILSLNSSTEAYHSSFDLHPVALELFLDIASQSCLLCLADSTLQSLPHISLCCSHSSPMEPLWPVMDSWNLNLKCSVLWSHGHGPLPTPRPWLPYLLEPQASSLPRRKSRLSEYKRHYREKITSLDWFVDELLSGDKWKDNVINMNFSTLKSRRIIFTTHRR